jgi:hypothetical protein
VFTRMAQNHELMQRAIAAAYQAHASARTTALERVGASFFVDSTHFVTFICHHLHMPDHTPPTHVPNFVVCQAAWFAAVLGAAHQWPLWGTAAVVAAMVWHLVVSARPTQEAKLMVAACLLGFVVETATSLQGHVIYTSGQPDVRFAPYWMVAMWGLLAISLNVTMRWLKGRVWLAAALGAVVGPASYASGVRLGAAQFVAATPALVTLALVWLVAMPFLMWLSDRFDGVAVPRTDTATLRHGNMTTKPETAVQNRA